ncbi:MAG: type IV secretion system protein [Flavobacteriaceae bacterium]
MNIADQIYLTMYNIIVVKLLPSLTQLIINLNSTGFFKQITIIAVMVIGLLMIYGKMNRVTFVKSFITIFIVYSLFVSVPGNIYLLDTLRSLFIDGPIKYGSYLVDTISSVIYQGTTITQQTINLEPGAGGTAFGKLWQISTDLASAVWDAGGLSDIGAFFIGFALYGVAVFLLVAQILMLGTFLIMSAAAIYAAPLFIPMVLFNSTRQMFQSWVGFGLGGAFGLIMLMIMMGIIFGFVSITFLEVFGIDLSTGEVGDIDDISDMGKIGAMVVFMLISIKLLPKIEMWASSLAGASAAGISDASMAVGSAIGRHTGLTAQKAAKQLNQHAVKPAAGAVKRGLGRAVDRFRNRSAKSNTASKPSDAQHDTKQRLANSKLKNSIRNRLVSRGQDQKRPLAQLSNKEQSIQKRQTMQHKKSQSAQGQSPKPNHSKNNGTNNESRGLNKNVKQPGKSESTNKSSESQKKVSSSNNTSAAQRPAVKSDSSKGTVEKQKAEKTTTSKTETQSPKSSTSGSNKSSIAGSQKSSKTNTTNTTLSQKTSNTSSQRSKPIDRNSKIKEQKARETHRKQLDDLQTEQETKRRETSKKPTKKKKKGDDE